MSMFDHFGSREDTPESYLDLNAERLELDAHLQSVMETEKIDLVAEMGALVKSDDEVGCESLRATVSRTTEGNTESWEDVKASSKKIADNVGETIKGLWFAFIDYIVGVFKNEKLARKKFNKEVSRIKQIESPKWRGEREFTLSDPKTLEGKKRKQRDTSVVKLVAAAETIGGAVKKGDWNAVNSAVLSDLTKAEKYWSGYRTELKEARSSAKDGKYATKDHDVAAATTELPDAGDASLTTLDTLNGFVKKLKSYSVGELKNGKTAVDGVSPKSVLRRLIGQFNNRSNAELLVVQQLTSIMKAIV